MRRSTTRQTTRWTPAPYPLRKDSGETIVTPLLRYELDTERGSAEDAQFAFAAGAARGEAGRIRFEGRDALTLESVRYTTCAGTG